MRRLKKSSAHLDLCHFMELSKVLVLDCKGVGWPWHIGAISWNLDSDERAELAIDIPHALQDQLILAKAERKMTPENKLNASVQSDFEKLNAMANNCDVILAHNATHNKQLVSAFEELEPLLDKNWTCMMRNFQWNCTAQTPSLQKICEAYNVPYDKAISGCQHLVKCLSLTPNFKERLRHAWRKPPRNNRAFRRRTIIERKNERQKFECIMKYKSVPRLSGVKVEPK